MPSQPKSPKAGSAAKKNPKSPGKTPIRGRFKSPLRIKLSPKKKPQSPRSPLSKSSRSPVKKSPAHSPKSPGKKGSLKVVAKKNFVKSPKTPIKKKSPVKKQVKKSPGKKLVGKSPVKKSTPKSPVKKPVARSPAKTPVAKSPVKKVTVKKSPRVTNTSPKSPSMSTKRYLIVKLSPANVPKLIRSVVKKSPVQATKGSPGGSGSPRKRTSSGSGPSPEVSAKRGRLSVVSDSPTKGSPKTQPRASPRARTESPKPQPQPKPSPKTKPESPKVQIRQSSQGKRTEQSPKLQSPPRPTRVIVAPARYAESPPRSEAHSPDRARRSTTVSARSSTGASPARRSSQLNLRSPPKPTRVTSNRAGTRGRSESTRSTPQISETRKTTSSRSQSIGEVTKQHTPDIRASRSSSAIAAADQKNSPGRLTRSSEPQGRVSRSSSLPASTSPDAKNLAKEKASGDKKVQIKPSTSHPCRFCGLVFKSRSDGELHEKRCSKNDQDTEKRVPCSQCSGMFTVKDLALHMKQAHPPNPSKTPKPGEVQPEAAIRKSKPSMVIKVPHGQDLNAVIKQAINAAASAGLVPSDKRLVLHGPDLKKSGIKSIIEPKRKALPEEAPRAKKQKVQHETSTGKPTDQVPEPQTRKVASPVVIKPKALKDRRTVTCLDCGSVIQNRAMLAGHKRVCPAVGPNLLYACFQCHQTFSSSVQLRGHKQHSHPYHGDQDSRAWEDLIAMKGYKCNICKDIYKTEQELKEHTDQLHNGKCDGMVCNVMASPPPIMQDVSPMTASYQMAEKVINDIVNGVAQRRTPNMRFEASFKRKPAQCLDCGVKVSSRLELAKHKRICVKSIEATRIVCFDCSEVFKSYRELGDHKRERHLHQQLKCGLCDLTFESNSQWADHQQQRHEKATASTIRQSGPPNKRKKKQTFKDPEVEEIPVAAKKTAPLTRAKRNTPEKPAESKGKGKGKGKSTMKASTKDTPMTIGTLQYVNDGVEEIEIKQEPDDAEVSEMPMSPPSTVLVPRRPSSPAISIASSSSEAKTAAEGKDATDDRTSISLANGLVTISADKSKDYEIFVDAKPDGSSIQVKLVRTKEASQPSQPSQPTQASQPSTSKSPVKGPEKTPPTRKAATRKSSQKQAEPAGQASEKTSNKEGKVVQKGQPINVGGQRMVPIQLPPGITIPPGAGGSKMFAIPASGLPPGLLELLNKQSKQKAAPQGSPVTPVLQKSPLANNPPVTTASQRITSVRATAPTPQQEQSTKSKSMSHRPAILSRGRGSSPVAAATPVATPPSAAKASPPSLKGMTGGQILARAQAKILGHSVHEEKAKGADVKTAPMRQSAKTAPGSSQPPPVSSATTVIDTAEHCLKPRRSKPVHFIFQCTACHLMYRTSHGFHTHMKSCTGMRKLEKTSKKKSGDWHIQPVTTGGKHGRGSQGVEWYVASNTS